MVQKDLGLLLAICSLLGLATASSLEAAVDFDIVYVRQPRYGDETNTIWPEVFHPARAEPGADLVLLHPDGSEEVLVQGGNGAVTDPYVSFDGEWVLYSYFYDLRQQSLNYQRNDLPHHGADIFRLHVPSRTVEQLTFGEFTPNTGAGNWDESNPLNPPPEFNRLGYGILNLGPCPVPGGRVAFTSNRNGFTPPKGYTSPTLQLFVMDEDGRNVEAIAPMSISSALHPTILRDGRLLFSSHESQALRDRRMWGIWSIYPDGRQWSPVVSAFRSAQAFHFMTQLSDGDLVVVDYYNLNNNGFGALYRLPTGPPAGTPAFGSPFPSENPQIEQTVGGGFSYPFRMSFTPFGLHSISPFTHANDEAAPIGGDGTTRVGKFTHPSAAPDNDLLVVWTPGPANDLNRPTPLPRYDAGLYLIAGGEPVASASQLVAIKNDSAFNEAWPRALVAYSEIHGVAEPNDIERLANDGSLHPSLPPGTAYGLVGTSSLYKRESYPGHVTSWANEFDGLDAFNTGENGQSSNWSWQGADAGLYDNSEIWAIRLLAMEPNTHRSYGPNLGRQFESHANERLRILGEIPVRKQNQGQPVLDPEGNPDTSFLARIPADTPFTFQTLDRDGLVLNMAQTWHQVRPGEIRTDCGGCHSHSQMPLDFDLTEAGKPGFEVVDLTSATPLLTKDGSGNPALRQESAGVSNVEFYRDIRPLLQTHCVSCHRQDNASPHGELDLDDLTIASDLPGDYRRLAADEDAQFGIAPVISNGTWRQSNASRYIRKFQSRRSLLIWKIFGRRLDGWTNGDHPTETVPGDPTTLPAGADPNDADLDYTGTAMPPPGSGSSLSEDEKMTFARWIDLGCPIDTGPIPGSGELGWFLDDLRPTLSLSQPMPGFGVDPLETIRFGMSDAYTGVDRSTLSISADFQVAGRPPGAELEDLALAVGDGVYEITLGGAAPVESGELRFEVADSQGNLTRVVRSFSTEDGLGGPEMIFQDGFESGDDAEWSGSQP